MNQSKYYFCIKMERELERSKNSHDKFRYLVNNKKYKLLADFITDRIEDNTIDEYEGDLKEYIQYPNIFRNKHNIRLTFERALERITEIKSERRLSEIKERQRLDGIYLKKFPFDRLPDLVINKIGTESIDVYRTMVNLNKKYNHILTSPMDRQKMLAMFIEQYHIREKYDEYEVQVEDFDQWIKYVNNKRYGIQNVRRSLERELKETKTPIWGWYYLVDEISGNLHRSFDKRESYFNLYEIVVDIIKNLGKVSNLTMINYFHPGGEFEHKFIDKIIEDDYTDDSVDIIIERESSLRIKYDYVTHELKYEYTIDETDYNDDISNDVSIDPEDIDERDTESDIEFTE